MPFYIVCFKALSEIFVLFMLIYQKIDSRFSLLFHPIKMANLSRLQQNLLRFGKPHLMVRDHVVSCEVSKAWAPGLETMNTPKFQDIVSDLVFVNPRYDKTVTAVLEMLADKDTTENIVNIEGQDYHIYIDVFDKTKNSLTICKAKLHYNVVDQKIQVFEDSRRRLIITFQPGFIVADFIRTETVTAAVSRHFEGLV